MWKRRTRCVRRESLSCRRKGAAATAHSSHLSRQRVRRVPPFGLVVKRDNVHTIETFFVRETHPSNNNNRNRRQERLPRPVRTASRICCCRSPGSFWFFGVFVSGPNHKRGAAWYVPHRCCSGRWSSENQSAKPKKRDSFHQSHHSCHPHHAAQEQSSSSSQ